MTEAICVVSGVLKRDDGLDTLPQLKSQRLGARAMLVPCFRESSEALEAVGVDGGAGPHVASGEFPDGSRAEIGNDFHPDSSRPTPPPLHGGEHQRSLSSLELAASSEACLGATHPRLVKFDLAPERLASMVDHRATKLVENHPGRLIPADPKLALEQKGGQASLVRRHQVGGPEPRREWCLRVVKNSPCCHGNLVSARNALPSTSADQCVRPPIAAPGTREPVRPSTRGHVVRRGLVGGKVHLKLAERRREGRSSHVWILPVVVS